MSTRKGHYSTAPSHFTCIPLLQIRCALYKNWSMSDWKWNHAFMSNVNLLFIWHSRSTRALHCCLLAWYGSINCNLTRHNLPHSNRNNHSLFYQGKKVAPILRIWPLPFLKNCIFIHLCLLLCLLSRHSSTSDRWSSEMYWKHEGMGDIGVSRAQWCTFFSV